jgi:hypothetical protein
MKISLDEVVELGFDTDGITSAELVIGVNEAACRGLDGTGVPCTLYLWTTEGRVRGTGAHPGYVVEVPISELARLGASEVEIFEGLGCYRGEYLDRDGEAICLDCLDYMCDDARVNNPRVEICRSCRQMAEESLAECLAERGVR